MILINKCIAVNPPTIIAKVSGSHPVVNTAAELEPINVVFSESGIIFPFYVNESHVLLRPAHEYLKN